DEFLDNLPSRVIYREFDAGTSSTCGSIGEVRNALRSLPDIGGEHKNKIYRACCYAPEMQEGDSPYSRRYNFLYYYMGDILWKYVTDDTLFLGIMSLICDKIKEMCNKQGCMLTCGTVNKDLFSSRKTVFDYYHDYGTLKNLLPSIEPTCVPECGEHIQKITEACSAMKEKCPYTSNSGDSYCNWFRTNGEQYCDADKLSNLKCTKKPSAGDDFDLGDAVVDGGNDDPPPPPKPKPNPNPNQAGSSGSFSDADLADGVSGGEGKGGSDGGGSHRKENGEESGASSVVPGAVSGALAAVGLPALAYFFYKYKSHLFFFKKHNHSGNGRRKRSLRRELNRFSNDDDESTEYDSTTEDSSEYSIPYTSSSSGG
ncbi:KIR protein, partial [Plasmodium coatneyi]